MTEFCPYLPPPVYCYVVCCSASLWLNSSQMMSRGFTSQTSISCQHLNFFLFCYFCEQIYKFRTSLWSPDDSRGMSRRKSHCSVQVLSTVFLLQGYESSRSSVFSLSILYLILLFLLGFFPPAPLIFSPFCSHKPIL